MNQTSVKEKELADARASDLLMCRMLIGLDDPFEGSHKALVMACAEDTIAAEVAKGERRSQAARTAWKQCMPDITVCDKVLK